MLNKIERDMKVAKAENNVIKFAWISIVIGVVMIILGNVFDDNPFIDFISAALHGYFRNTCIKFIWNILCFCSLYGICWNNIAVDCRKVTFEKRWI